MFGTSYSVLSKFLELPMEQYTAVLKLLLITAPLHTTETSADIFVTSE
jgi:hypothetical protein